jgi:hypothetical protein
MAIDREKLRSIVERVQVGDTDEGVEAMTELLDEHSRSSGGGTGQAVRRELVNMQFQAESEKALERFGQRWSNIAKDQDLSEVGMKKLGENMAADLRAVGLSEEDIAPARGDVGRLFQAHTAARLQGLKVRSTDDLLEATGRQLGDKFKIAPTARTRQEIVRAARTARGFANREEDDSSSARRTPSPAEDARRARARRHLEAARKARGFESMDSY